MSDSEKLAEIHRLGEQLVAIGESIKQLREVPERYDGGIYQLHVGLRNSGAARACNAPLLIDWYEYPIVHSDRRVVEDLAEILLRQKDIVGVRIENTRETLCG